MKKLLKGTVVSNKMQKTVVVEVRRQKKHPKYAKYFWVSKRYKVHMDGELPSVGAEVTIEETKPISKEKRWRIKK